MRVADLNKGTTMQTEMKAKLVQLASELATELYGSGETEILRTLLNCVEKGAIGAMLTVTDGHRGKTANILGINRLTLNTRIDLHGLEHLTASNGVHQRAAWAAKRNGGVA